MLLFVAMSMDLSFCKDSKDHYERFAALAIALHGKE